METIAEQDNDETMNQSQIQIGDEVGVIQPRTKGRNNANDEQVTSTAPKKKGMKSVNPTDNDDFDPDVWRRQQKKKSRHERTRERKMGMRARKKTNTKNGT